MTERGGPPTPRGGRAGGGRSRTSPGQRFDLRGVPLGGYRLVISTLGGFVFILAVVMRSEGVCLLAAAVVLVSALLVRDSFRPGLRGWVFVAGAHGATVAAVIGIVAWKVSWSPAALVVGAAALIFVAQVVPSVNWSGTSDAKRLEQLRRSVEPTTSGPTSNEGEIR